MNEERDIFMEARLFLKRKRLEKYGVTAIGLRVVRDAPESGGEAHTEDADIPSMALKQSV